MGSSPALISIRSTPAAQPQPGVGRPSQLLDQPVVAPSPTDARLRAQRIGGELEHRAGVVVKAAHERRIELVAQIGVVEHLADLGEVLGVIRSETVKQGRRPAHGRAGGRIVGVEGPHRVQVDARHHLGREAGLVRAQVGGELLAVLGPGGRGAKAGESQPRLPDADGPQQFGEQEDQLGVGLGSAGADHLRSDLPELAVAAPLRRFGAEERRQVPQLDRLRQLVHPVLQVRPAHGRRALGSQRQAAATAVVERVHLLLHDVGRLANAAGEQLGGLERRRLDAPVAGGAEDAVGVRFQHRAPRGVGGEHIKRATGSLKRAHGSGPGG